MKTDIAKTWTTALRSGEFSQTTNALHNVDGFCCLGVLCEVIAEPAGLVKTAEDDDKGTVLYNERAAALPNAALSFTGIRSSMGMFDLKGMDLDFSVREDTAEVARDGQYGFLLADLNDKGMPFDQIADIIDYFKDEL